MSQGWRFALPPSLGRESVRALARRFADLLYDAGFSTVLPQTSYAQVQAKLLDGEADAAWGPPLVCANVEKAGGRVLVRSVRWGAPTYRAAILTRADDRLIISELPRARRKPRAVWVDPDSMAGYVLPRAYLRSLGIDPEKVFLDETSMGSYDACIAAVLDGTADLTSCFASGEQATRPTHGYREIAGNRAAELRVVAYTRECPNDGLVLSPKLDGSARYALQLALERLLAHPATKPLLTELFDVDGFEESVPGVYSSLLDHV